MSWLRLVIPIVVMAVTIAILPSCKTVPTSTKAILWERELGAVAEAPISPNRAHQELNIKVDLIPKGKYGRRIFRRMQPRYITIHSTQNRTGDAYAHSKALKRGSLRGGVVGYLCWHFTVQDDVVIQHIPTDERGEHADFDGPGNRYSIGIEMCEHRGNDQVATMDRTAKLAATLMYYHQIPVENVRAHYHWPREGYETPNKNCPHFLLEGGRPGTNWRWFVGRINRHHERLVAYNEYLREKQKQEERDRHSREIVQLPCLHRFTCFGAFT